MIYLDTPTLKEDDNLKFVNILLLQNSMEVCRLERRRRNAKLLADKLAVMSHLHQTQPKIQLLLSGNEFSGKT